LAGYITLGAGAVVAGVGTGFLVSSLDSRSKADEAFACDARPTGCTLDEKARVDGFDDDADRKQMIAIGGLVVGGALITTSIVLLVTADSGDESQVGRRSPSLRLVASPTWLGAVGTF
jgi:hypothetical protein